MSGNFLLLVENQNSVLEISPFEIFELELNVINRLPSGKTCFSLSNFPRNAASVFICMALFIFGRTAAASLEEDLRISFHGDRNLPPPGGIAGSVTNQSSQYYPCIDLVFGLFYKNGASGPKEQRVQVRNLSPKQTKHYSAPLWTKAGFGLKHIETCTVGSGETPTPPNPIRDCTITGSVTSTIGFEGVGDTGGREKIERVFLLTTDGKLVSEERLSERTNHVRDHRNGKTYDSRRFEFARIPANLSYVVKLSNAWKSVPPEIVVHCPDAQGRYEFKIAPLRHTGNRLGG